MPSRASSRNAADGDIDDRRAHWPPYGGGPLSMFNPLRCNRSGSLVATSRALNGLAAAGGHRDDYGGRGGSACICTNRSVDIGRAANLMMMGRGHQRAASTAERQSPNIGFLDGKGRGRRANEGLARCCWTARGRGQPDGGHRSRVEGGWIDDVVISGWKRCDLCLAPVG